jgi:malonyl-CoA/methylmalonyl-CoA synthetase
MGTAPLPAKVRDEFGAAFSCTPLESWGMTEVLLGTVVPPEDPRDATVGRMIGGVSIVSRDDGELWVKSAYALLGYLDTDGAVGPNGADAEGWFPTGDLGGVDADGMVVISGRKKDLIIHGGTNVSPRAVEETLLQDPGVLDSAVVGVKHAFWGEEVVACLQLAPHVALADIEARLKELCRTRLPADAVPARFVAFAEFPRSSTGKVQKRGLLERL